MMSASFSPDRIRARASLTQTGQSESVVRGQPSSGEDFSQLRSSGRDAHGGWNEAVRRPRPARMQTLQARSAARATTVSNALVNTICFSGPVSRWPIICLWLSLAFANKQLDRLAINLAPARHRQLVTEDHALGNLVGRQHRCTVVANLGRRES